VGTGAAPRWQPVLVRSRILCGIAGWTRLAAWLAALDVVTDPWRSLGGLVDERLRWTALVAGAVAVALGVTAARSGSAAGDLCLRPLLVPPAAASALAFVALWAVGERDAVSAVLTVGVSWTFGVDLVAGAVPLLGAVVPSAVPASQKGRNRRI